VGHVFGLFDKDGDAVDDLFGYVDRGAASDALSEYEAGGRNTHEDVHTGEMCTCPLGPLVHEWMHGRDCDDLPRD
jgi:hypothetical protein